MTIEFWLLIGTALIFWMQAGFAMVETGFTRAKNAGNIIMKNLMDFCIGTIVFSILGYFHIKHKGKSKIASRFIPTLNEKAPPAEAPEEN